MTGEYVAMRNHESHPTLALKMVLMVMLSVIATTAASGKDFPSDLTDGVWRGEGGPQTFLFQFANQGGTLTGLVHTMGDGMKMTEMLVDQVKYDPPNLTLRFPHGPLFKGQVDLEKKLIKGSIVVDGAEAGEMPLTWIDPAEVPELTPGMGRYSDQPYTYQQPQLRDDRWQTAHASATGLPIDKLEALVGDILDGEAGVLHALLIAQGGQLVLEEYFHGCHPDYPHGQLSVTKSVASLLTGIAIDRGEIANVSVPLIEFFPDCPRSGSSVWPQATLEHLLTMSLGLDWAEGQMHNLHGTGSDFFCQVLGRGFHHQPGDRWNYVNADVNLLAGVLKKATGMQADKYAEKHLFQPLGFQNWNWDHMMQEGYPLMDGSLRLRARDMLTLGQLILAGGELDGKRIVSREWVAASTSSQIETGEPEGYGYLWWLFPVPTPQGVGHVPVANGWGSQFIIVLPEMDLVVVTMGGNQDNGKHMAVIRLLVRHLKGL